MPRLVMLPAQDELRRTLGQQLAVALPMYEIVVAESDDDARLAIADAEAAFGFLSPGLLPFAAKLRWLHSPQIAPQAGFYYPELNDPPVVITNPRGTFNDHIGQHILMSVLALARGLPYYMEAQRERRWDEDAPASPYIDLSASTALIHGVGGIGKEAARLCVAFGMYVIGIYARWEFDVRSIDKHGPGDLDELLPQADFVIVTVPHTPETEGMWHAGRFRLMKNTAHFINIGRGLTTKLDDLVAALEEGVIAGCALDVFEVEPLPANHKLWKMPNVILTPHIAAKFAENVAERQFQILLDNARRFAAGEPLRNIVDKSVWY